MPDPFKEVTIALVVSMTLLLGFATAIVFTLLTYQKKRFQNSQQLMQMENHMQQEILRTQLETQENTAHRIGEDLHDNIGQLLSTAAILLGISERSLVQVPPTFVTAQDTLRKAIHELRSLSRSLDKEWLTQFNLIENLETEIARINAAKIIDISIYSSETILPLTNQNQIILFRIIQETLQNSMKHSAATAIDINILARQEQIEVLVRDNGKGLDTTLINNQGMGFANIKNRTKLLGGTVEWFSSINKGTEIHIIVPTQII